MNWLNEWNININKILENKTPKKVVNIFKKSLILMNKKKDKGIKTLTPKQTLEKLSVALAPVKASNTSANLLNEMRQIIYSSYREKELTKCITIWWIQECYKKEWMLHLWVLKKGKYPILRGYY